MERQGQPVLLVPLLKLTPAVTHREASAWTKRALYTPFLSAEILRANLRMLRRRPWPYVALLWRIATGTIASPNFFVRSLALFPKSVFLAERLEREGIRHLHAHYATHPTTVALIASTLTGMTFSFTVHAHDIFVRRHAAAMEARGGVLRSRDLAVQSRVPRAPLPRGARTQGSGDSRRDQSCPYDRATGEAPSCEPRTPGRRHILCVASLQHYKGIPVLLDACSLLKRRQVEFTCTIVGEGPMRPALEAQIGRSGCRRGWCSPARVRSTRLPP